MKYPQIQTQRPQPFYSWLLDRYPKTVFPPELDFLKSLWGLETEEEEGYRTGPPGYIGWRNSFLGIDSGAPYTFKNTGSVSDICYKIGRNKYSDHKK